ncbi:hypothetical protein P3T16_002514 [Paraburkholderia sp. GAS42]|jgi:hypothetical protein
MVCQTRVRHDDRREYTKHMLRLRHAKQITGDEANEIVLLNSHDGMSSYQMLAGVLRFVCQNGYGRGRRRPGYTRAAQGQRRPERHQWCVRRSCESRPSCGGKRGGKIRPK